MDLVNSLSENPFKFFVGFIGTVLLSIFSAFIKDWILKIFSHFSARFKAKKERQKALLNAQAEVLLSNTNLLFLFGFKTMMGNILFIAVMIMSLIVPFSMSTSLHLNQRFAKYADLPFAELSFHDPIFLPIVLTNILSIFLMISFILITYMTTKRNRVLYHTLRVCKKKYATAARLP